jgi:hypothetical protein
VRPGRAGGELLDRAAGGVELAEIDQRRDPIGLGRLDQLDPHRIGDLGRAFDRLPRRVEVRQRGAQRAGPLVREQELRVLQIRERELARQPGLMAHRRDEGLARIADQAEVVVDLAQGLVGLAQDQRSAGAFGFVDRQARGGQRVVPRVLEARGARQRDRGPRGVAVTTGGAEAVDRAFEIAAGPTPILEHRAEHVPAEEVGVGVDRGAAQRLDPAQDPVDVARREGLPGQPELGLGAAGRTARGHLGPGRRADRAIARLVGLPTGPEGDRGEAREEPTTHVPILSRASRPRPVGPISSSIVVRK